VIYRDDHERCPRCGVDLVQAGSARGCTACQGLWVRHEVLAEMAATMTAPAPAKPMYCYPDPIRQPLPCPTCTEVMQAWNLLGVPIDRCDRDGLWFDRSELQQVLYATWSRDRR
jgi:Zn-finger nucleic acid-binding protein